MSKKNSLIKKVVAILTWFALLTQHSWCSSECDISVNLHPPQSDTLQIPDKWIAWDKMEHLGASVFFSGVSYNIFRDFYNNKKESSLCFSASITLCLGLGKEIYDKKTQKGRFSYKDLVADIVGMGLGLWIATR